MVDSICCIAMTTQGLARQAFSLGRPGPVAGCVKLTSFHGWHADCAMWMPILQGRFLVLPGSITIMPSDYCGVFFGLFYQCL